MKKLLLGMSLLLSMTAFADSRNPIEITINNENYELLDNDNNDELVKYESKLGCLEMQRGHHSPFSFPGKRDYVSYLDFVPGNTMTIDYKGEKSICMFRGTEVRLSFGPVERNEEDNIQDWRELVGIHHTDSSSNNEVTFVCGRFTKNYRDVSYTNFKCKLKGQERYPDGLVQFSANLSQDITINVEMDPESEELK